MPLELRIKTEATCLGFSLCGIAPATEADGFDRFTDWLSKSYHGEMAYLPKSVDQREHPRGVLNSVQSVIMLAFEYGPGTKQDPDHHHGRVAAYAQGPDYHEVLWDKLNQLAAWLKRQQPDCETKGVVDTAPLLERDFARRAGLGWIGKNTMLINPKLGSYFFLGALLTNVALVSDPPFESDHCGRCTACLDACPTGAFPTAGTLDATKCISYLTIEHRTAISLTLREGIHDWIYGCDVCQDVCPWNRFAKPSDFPRNPHLASFDCIELLGLSDAQFRSRFRGTVFFRAKRQGLLRNAAIVLGNTGDASCLSTLELAKKDESDVVREAAVWAIDRVNQRLKKL